MSFITPTPTQFPAPIGGVPFPHDFGPSVFFAVLYGLCVPLVFFRLIHKRSRMFVIIGTMSFTIERIIDFSLRAIESRNASDRVSKFFISWLQTTYAAGFISIGQDLAIVARTYLVHTTMGSIDKPITPFRSTDQPEAPLTSYYGDSASSSSSGYRDLSLSVDEADREDELRRRFWIRRFTGSPA